MWEFAKRPSSAISLPKLPRICVYVYMCTHTYTYIHIYTCMVGTSLILTQPNIYVHIWLHGCIYIYTFVFIEVISLKSLNTCLFINLSEHSHSKYA